MFRLTFGFVLAFVALFGLAHAQNNEIFTVPKVTVYAEGASASEAQAKAQGIGRRRAMDMLLRRLTAEEDWTFLPSLAAGRPASAPAAVPTLPDFDTDGFGQAVAIVTKSPVVITGASLNEMEEGFAIFEEKTSPSTYRAKITYRFKPDAVRALLQKAGLPYSEAQARRALIVPVLETANGVYLWETKNPWARAWLDRPLVNELTPLILPVGDRQDIEAITAREAAGLSVVGLGELARRYRVDQVIVAVGKVQEKDDEFHLLVRLRDAYFADRADTNAAAAAAAEAAARYDSEDGFGTASVRVDEASRRGQVLAETFFRGPTDDFPALAQRAVETTVARYASTWKEKTLVDHSAVRSLRLTAWFEGLREWGRIQRALEGTPLVTKLNVGAMNKDNAVIDLTLIGDNRQLILAMAQSGLTVWRSGDGMWNIADNGRAQTLQLELSDVGISRREMERFNRSDADPTNPEDSAGALPSFGPADGVVDGMVGTNVPGGPVLLDAPVALQPIENAADEAAPEQP